GGKLEQREEEVDDRCRPDADPVREPEWRHGAASPRDQVVDRRPWVDEGPEVADQAGQDDQARPEVDPGQILSRVAGGVLVTEEASHDDRQQPENADGATDGTEDGWPADSQQPRRRKARNADGARAQA